MANYQTDIWNITTTNSYSVTVNDSMTVQSGNQYLDVKCQNTTGDYSGWILSYKSGSLFELQVENASFVSFDSGMTLPCENGIVTITVVGSQLTCQGTTTTTVSLDSSMTYPTAITTENGDGNFNSGQLEMTLTNQ